MPTRSAFLIPDGILVKAVPDIRAARERTAELIRQSPSHPIFEATFQHDNVWSGDILKPHPDGGWRAIEVKASTRVKAYQLADFATQIWVMRGCGLQISEAVVRHLAPPL